MTLKEMLIASPECTFKMYRNASLFYVTQQGFVFEVPIAELGESSLGHTERSLSLMKWIRRAVDSLKECNLLQASDVLDFLHDSSANIDEALYNLFDISDQMMQSGRFDLIDEILQQAQLEKITVAHLIGLLTVSMWCKTKLQHRSDFFDKCETHLIGIGRPNVEELLRGLR